MLSGGRCQYLIVSPRMSFFCIMNQSKTHSAGPWRHYVTSRLKGFFEMITSESSSDEYVRGSQFGEKWIAAAANVILHVN